MDFALRPPHKPLCLCVSVLKRLQFGEAVSGNTGGRHGAACAKGNKHRGT